MGRGSEFIVEQRQVGDDARSARLFEALSRGRVKVCGPA